MNKQSLLEKEQLTEEAVYWVVKLHSKDVTHSEKVAFSKWLNSSHQHEQAFDEINATWTSLGKAKYLPEIQEQVARLITPPKHRLSLSLSSWLQVAFAAALLVVVGYVNYWPTQTKTAPAATTYVTQSQYQTAAGEDRIVDLDDGSSIHLNTRTNVLVQYTTHKRLITLKQGEAHFVVAPDKSRPFVVTMGNTKVTAVGTAFNILRQANQTTVTITEGIVAVKGKGDEHAEAMRIPAHRKVKLVDDRILSVEDTTTLNEIAWQQKQLIFRSEPLNVVFKELNRYLDKTVVIDDPALKSLRLTGTFDLSNPEDILQALKESYDLDESLLQGYRFISRKI